MVLKSPTVRHRRLGRELRRLREEAGFTPEQAAQHLGWSRSKLNRIEIARIKVTVPDIAKACDLYGVTAEAKATLAQLGREANQRGWWAAYSDVLAGAYVSLEADAAHIRTWEPLLIPGLFQTEDYARAIISERPDLDEDELQRRVAARMQRKVALLSSKPTVHVLIDETALRRPIGAASAMAAQLDDLVQISGWPTVTIQVLPMAAGPHSGLNGSFSIFSFDEEDPDVAYAGGPAGEAYLEDPAQVRDLTLAFERLLQKALTPEESVALITTVRSDHA
ncbi:helix-turn-helix domain-containing protein [Streptosporangium sp. NPDC001559]|uniref:helix-turn-helix domain-containing protein n=1 Tax=unclassified Streptosporangium TaxID=2632669 RepID=UPI0036E86F82